jgi:hypothetical protein
MPQAWADQPLLDRMVTAVEGVRDRLRRTAAALGGAGVPYAIVGDDAVAAWVATVDPTAVRNTQAVDVLLRRGELDAAERAKRSSGARGFACPGGDGLRPARCPAGERPVDGDALGA